jgi:hypothetical protein
MLPRLACALLLSLRIDFGLMAVGVGPHACGSFDTLLNKDIDSFALVYYFRDHLSENET